MLPQIRYNYLIQMDIKDRVKLIMDQESLTSSEFADRADIQQSTFSHFINGRNKASLDVVMKIHQAFEQVRLEWLLYGKGEMYDQISQGNGGSSSNNASIFTEKDFNNNGHSVQPTSSLEGLSAAAPIFMQQAQHQVAASPAKPVRKITEIRVFFDDNTYEVFRAGE